MSQMTPPNQSDFMPTTEAPKWPTVVGIISIVWGSLGVICNGCGALSPIVGNAMVNMVPPEQQDQLRQQMAAGSSPVAVAISVLAVLMSVFLIAAGLMTLKRRGVGRVMHLGWASISILLGIAGGFLGWSAVQAQVQQMQGSNPQQAAAQQAGAVGGMAIGVCFGLLYPIFCLVWFGALGKRPEAGALPQDAIV